MDVDELCCGMTEIKQNYGHVFSKSGANLFEFEIQRTRKGKIKKESFTYFNRIYRIYGRIDGECFVIYLGTDDKSVVAVNINGELNKVEFEFMQDGLNWDYIAKYIE